MRQVQQVAVEDSAKNTATVCNINCSV